MSDVDGRLRLLTNADRDLLDRFCGVNGRDRQTMKAIAADFSTTGPTIARRIDRAMRKIQKSILLETSPPPTGRPPSPDAEPYRDAFYEWFLKQFPQKDSPERYVGLTVAEAVRVAEDQRRREDEEFEREWAERRAREAAEKTAEAERRKADAERRTGICPVCHGAGKIDPDRPWPDRRLLPLNDNRYVVTLLMLEAGILTEEEAAGEVNAGAGDVRRVRVGVLEALREAVGRYRDATVTPEPVGAIELELIGA